MEHEARRALPGRPHLPVQPLDLPGLEPLLLSQEDHSRFDTIDDLLQDVALHGYYGGIRLIKATIKRFVDYCNRKNLKLHDRNFSVRYQTNIPRQVGMAGSSALIVATLRALMEFYGIEIPREVQPAFVLSIEAEELGITAGLQDRVIQVYEGVVYMNFDVARERIVDGYKCYAYESLDPALPIDLCCVPGESQRADRDFPY